MTENGPLAIGARTLVTALDAMAHSRGDKRYWENEMTKAVHYIAEGITQQVLAQLLALKEAAD